MWYTGVVTQTDDVQTKTPKTTVCPGCTGRLSATRKTSLQQVLAVHETTCPARGKKQTAPIKDTAPL